MAGTLRTRSRIRTRSGFKIRLTNQENQWYSWVETIHDVVGNPLGLNPLQILNDSDFKGSFNGIRPGYSAGDLGYVEYSNFLPDAVRLYNTYPPWPLWLGESIYAVSLAAQTNPSTPHIAVPVSLIEMRDIPRLVQTYGRTLLRWGRNRQSIVSELAEHNLAYQFGIRPIVQDVRRMAAFNGAARRRVIELNTLQANGGIKRNQTLQDTLTEIHDGVVVLSSTNDGPNAIFADRTKKSERKVWGSMRWKPTGLDNLPASDDDRSRLAFRLVAGLDHRNITSNVWEALPWSWLYDWFANVGDFIRANNNSIAHTPHRVCIMNKGNRHALYDNLHISGGGSVPGWYGASSSFKRINWQWQERYVVPIASLPIARLPFLSSGKLSILGSLAILGSRRGFRA